MAHSDDLRIRVVDAVVVEGMSRNGAAKHFRVSIASAIRWVLRFNATGEITPAPTGGDQRSGRIEAHRDYLLGLIRRESDITLLEIRERLIANCGERFSLSVIWRFFDRHEILIQGSSYLSTKPGLPPIWRARADGVGEAEGCASAFLTAITRPSRSSPVCASQGWWRGRLTISR
jgi:transposase